MPIKNRLTREHLELQPYGPELLREADLVIATNLVDSMARNETLYDDQITRRVAHFCAPLDADCNPKFLGVIPIPYVPGEPHHTTFERLKQDLAQHPRGHWAIYAKDGTYDSWISNGVGGTDTVSGHKFIHGSPDAPALTFEIVYAQVFSLLVYHRRHQIRDEILTATVNAAGLTPGQRWKNLRYDGKTWSNIVYLGSDRSAANDRKTELFRLSRRGTKTQQKSLNNDGIIRMLELPVVMPQQYQDPGNAQRLQSLLERRQTKAQAVWDQFIDPDLSIVDRMRVMRHFSTIAETEFSNYASKAWFRHDGDTLTRTAYVGSRDETHLPTYTYSVEFEPNSDEIRECKVTPHTVSATSQAAAA